MIKVAYLSTYVPKRCGLATYTHHLRQGVRQAARSTGIEDQVIAMVGRDEPHLYDSFIWRLQRDERTEYRRMAERVNDSDIDVVSLQHEFGIFGGTAGEYVLEFVRTLRKPIVTTFHTVFEQPDDVYRDIQHELVKRSERVTVMSQRAVQYLERTYQVKPEQIRYIPHGTPGSSNKPKSLLRDRLGWSNRKVILTFGLLGPGKGIESMFDALASAVNDVPELLYVIAGQTHPEVLKRDGEAYRNHLRQRIEEKQLAGHVQFINRYLTETDLIDLISACDLYITPYPGMQQITSGTLAYAVGAGRPVLTTPYVYAQDLLADLPELLIPYGDSALWAKRIVEMLTDEDKREACERRIVEIGKQMHWNHVGSEHIRLFHEVVQARRGTEQGVLSLVTR